MRIAWITWLVVACSDDRERAPVTTPPPAPAPRDARTAPPGDAPLALAPHRFIRVTDFSEAPYPGWTAIEFPGLPAYDAATRRIAVGRIELSNLLATQPNVELWLMDTATKTVEPLPVWSQEESYALRGTNRAPEKLRELVLAMDARVTETEPMLASFTPIPATCVASDPPTTKWYPTCEGHEIWTCGDTVIRHPRTTRSGRRELLVLERGGKTTKLNVAKWIKPSFKIPSTRGGYEEQEMIACIQDARIIPGTSDVLLELAHACNSSGDMCSAGSHSFEVVTPP